MPTLLKGFRHPLFRYFLPGTRQEYDDTLHFVSDRYKET
jgi:hypothetical protein